MDTKTMTEAPSNYREYQNRVETLVDGIEDQYDEGDELTELVFETVDSSQLLIYYDQNISVLENSRNEPSEWKHLVADGDSWREVIQAMAYDVLRQDVWEEIHDRGIDE